LDCHQTTNDTFNYSIHKYKHSDYLQWKIYNIIFNIIFYIIFENPSSGFVNVQAQKCGMVEAIN